MYELFFSDHAGWFAAPAIIGTIFFTLRLVLMLVGGHVGDVAVDVDHGGGDLHHGDTADAFKVLSIQSIAAFLMGFGWGGLAAYRAAEWGLLLSTLFGLGTGAGMMWLLALLLKAMFDLQSSGNIDAEATIGAVGDVYVGLPARGEGRGQVRIVVNNRQRIYNAVSDGGAIATQSHVRVTGVNDDNTLTVTPA